MNSKRNHIILIGPVYAHGGISSLLQTILREETLQSKCLVEVIHTSDGQDGRLARQCYLAVKGLARLGRLSITKDIDIVHIHVSYGASFYRKLLFFWLAKLLRNKVIFHINSSRFEFYYRNKNPITRVLIRQVLEHSDTVVLVADIWRQQLLECFPALNPTRVKVLGNPISLNNAPISYEKSDSSTKTVVFFGHLKPSKGVFDLVYAASIVAERESNVSFVICGDGPETQSLQRLIEELGLAKAVSLVGWVDGEAKRAWLRQSYIFVLPSYKEGMPLAILEAMTFGLPVVSTRIAGIPDVIEEGKQGLLIEPGDIEGLADRIIRLLEDQDLWRTMSANAQVKVKEYSATRIADQWIRLYESLAV